MSERELLDEKKQWEKIRKGLDNWREKFNHRSAELSDLKKQTELLLRQWTMTYDEAKKKLAPLKLKKSIKSTLEDIRLVNDQIKSKENQLYLNQNAVTDFILRVDDAGHTLPYQRARALVQSDFVRIWYLLNSDDYFHHRLLRNCSKEQGRPKFQPFPTEASAQPCGIDCGRSRGVESR